MFLIVLPIAVVALLLGIAVIRNVSTTRKVRLDLASIALSARLASAGLIVGLSSIGESAGGHAPIAPWISIVVGALSLIAFVARQIRLQQHDRPLMDLRAFRTPTFTVEFLLILISIGALFGALIVLPRYLQNVLGVGTLMTGLLLLRVASQWE